jgi:hypothetical protein
LTYSVEVFRGLMRDQTLFFSDIAVLIGFSLLLPYLSIVQFKKNQE